MERNSLPENELKYKPTDYRDFRDAQINRISRQRESLNYRTVQTKEHALRSSIDFMSKQRPQIASEQLLSDLRNLPSSQKDAFRRPIKQLSNKNPGNDQGDFFIDQTYIPDIFNPNKHLRKNPTENTVTKRQTQEPHYPSPVNMRNSKYSSVDSIQTVGFPKVEERNGKSNQAAPKPPNMPYRQQQPLNIGSMKTTSIPVSTKAVPNFPNSSKASYSLDSLNGSIALSTEQKNSQLLSLQEKDKSNSRLQQNLSSIPKISSGSSLGQNPTSQGSMQVFSGLTNKNITLLPARSSSFLFNGREAIYAVNTTNGLIRSYNEDRVSIVINIKRKPDWPHSRWPNCSYFSLFDGHGGSLCADFLKDNLHRFILENNNFPENPGRAIEEGCAQAEHEFCKFALKQTNIDKSGSCALIVLIIDDKIYIGNVGDCRAISSEQNGKQFYSLTKDHKPEEPSEQERIVRNGGQVSKNNFLQSHKFLGSVFGGRINELPFRVYPGGLSVSRSFGDVMAKEVQFGGNPNVLIAKPEISTYRIDKRTDFIFIGCNLIRRRRLRQERDQRSLRDHLGLSAQSAEPRQPLRKSGEALRRRSEPRFDAEHEKNELR
jgi:serine/threonine protein phosphatase PrpC